MDEIPMAPFAAAIDEFRHLEFPDQLANLFRHRYNTIMILFCQARQENVFIPIIKTVCLFDILRRRFMKVIGIRGKTWNVPNAKYFGKCLRMGTIKAIQRTTQTVFVKLSA